MYYVYQEWNMKKVYKTKNERIREGSNDFGNMLRRDDSPAFFDLKKMTNDDDDTTDRSYSFMGLYRKYNEADLFELMHLIKKKQSGVREVEMASLFASFYGNTIFTIFYNDLIILKRIADMLER